MIALHVDLRIDPSRRDEFLDGITLQAQRSISEESGCLRFDVSQDRDDPDHYVFYEVYADPEALDAHFETAHFPSWKAIADRCIVDQRQTAATLLLALPNSDAESVGL